MTKTIIKLHYDNPEIKLPSKTTVPYFSYVEKEMVGNDDGSISYYTRIGINSGISNTSYDSAEFDIYENGSLIASLNSTVEEDESEIAYYSREMFYTQTFEFKVSGYYKASYYTKTIPDRTIILKLDRCYDSTLASKLLPVVSTTPCVSNIKEEYILDADHLSMSVKGSSLILNGEKIAIDNGLKLEEDTDCIAYESHVSGKSLIIKDRQYNFSAVIYFCRIFLNAAAAKADLYLKKPEEESFTNLIGTFTKDANDEPVRYNKSTGNFEYNDSEEIDIFTSKEDSVKQYDYKLDVTYYNASDEQISTTSVTGILYLN